MAHFEYDAMDILTKEKRCIFCGEEIERGAYWSLGVDLPIDEIFVGNCCKRHLISMYKDVILSQPYEDLFHFKERVIKEVDDCFSKELERQLKLERDKVKKGVNKLLKYEREIEILEKGE